MKFKRGFKQYCKEFVHNVFVHPMLMFMPVETAEKLHDKNADWAFRDRL